MNQEHINFFCILIYDIHPQNVKLLDMISSQNYLIAFGILLMISHNFQNGPIKAQFYDWSHFYVNVHDIIYFL